MNRRNFFSTIGAAIAGVVLGGEPFGPGSPVRVKAQEARATLELVDVRLFSSGNVGLGNLSGLVVDGSNGIAYPELGIRRIDGNPILRGTPYIDEGFTLQLKKDDGIAQDFDWYGAWL